MPTFMYKAANKNGVIVRNRVEEGSRMILIRKLKENDLLPISVIQTVARDKTVKKKKNKKEVMGSTTEIRTNLNKQSIAQKLKFYFASQEKITSRDITIFTQNFYLLKKANFNNVHALSTIIDSTENLTFAGILEDILAGVEAGEYMYKTMEYYSGIFPYIYINMIRVGELSGSLEISLSQAVEYLESSDKITKKIKGILIPNIAQFALLMVMLVVGTLYAIPQIQNVFDEIGTSSTLPAITIWFQGVVNLMVAYWPIPVVLIAVIIIIAAMYIRSPKGRYRFDLFKYTMPVFGKLMYSLDMSRFLKAMLLNLNNGMRIQDSIEVSKNVINNYVMLSMIENSINNILIGASWIEPFERSGLTSTMVTEMLKIGMQTDLSEMMQKLVDYMDIDINRIIEKITKVLPQLMYAVVGVVLIFFVVVVLVPMIQVYMGNFLFDAYLN